MEKRVRYALVVLALILAVLLVVLLFQYRSLQQQQLVSAHQLRVALFLEHHAPLPASDANVVRSWMTFDYINRLFALPTPYLQTQLNVATSSGYPRITLSEYAEKQNVSSTIILDQVENAIRAFSTSTASSSAATVPLDGAISSGA